MILRKKNRLTIFKALVDPMVKYYCIVVTLILLISRIWAWVGGNEWVLYSQDLTRLFLLALCSIAPSLLNVFVEAKGAKGMLGIKATGFVLTLALVAVVHMWFTPSGAGTGTSFIVTFLLVYAITFIYSSVYAVVINSNDKKVAEHINKKLAEIHRAENESHRG